MRQSLLTDELLTALEGKTLPSRRTTAEAAGDQPRKGLMPRGSEVERLAPYQRGMDARTIDWKGYLKNRKLLVKLYQAKGDLPVSIILDRSASMATGHKMAVATSVAAGLVVLAAKNLHRTELFMVSHRIDGQVPPGRGQPMARAGLDMLSQATPQGRTDLAALMEELLPRLQARTKAIVISDMLDPHDPAAALRALASRAEEVDILRLNGPDDLALPLDQDLRPGLVCPETGRRRSLDRGPEELRGLYIQRTTRYFRALEEDLLRGRRITVTPYLSTQGAASILMEYLSPGRATSRP